jgi:hypothetical protein
MCGSEPGCLDIVLVPKLQQSVNTHCGAENATRDVCWVGWSAGFGVYPVFKVSKMLISCEEVMQNTIRSRHRCQCRIRQVPASAWWCSLARLVGIHQDPEEKQKSFRKNCNANNEVGQAFVHLTRKHHHTLLIAEI